MPLFLTLTDGGGDPVVVDMTNVAAIMTVDGRTRIYFKAVEYLRFIYVRHEPGEIAAMTLDAMTMLGLMPALPEAV